VSAITVGEIQARARRGNVLPPRLADMRAIERHLERVFPRGTAHVQTADYGHVTRAAVELRGRRVGAVLGQPPSSEPEVVRGFGEYLLPVLYPHGWHELPPRDVVDGKWLAVLGVVAGLATVAFAVLLWGAA
jgi:hypothetical protein